MDASEELKQNDNEKHRHLLFKIADDEYAVDIEQVLEIRQWEPATPLPLTPNYVKGVVNKNGEIVPVLDLRLRLGLNEESPTEETSIVILKVRRERTRTIGVVVDAITEIQAISPDMVDKNFDIGKRKQGDYLEGLTNIEGRLVLLLNENNLLTQKALSM